MRIATIFTFTAALFVALASAQAPAPFTLTISTDQPEVKVGADIHFTIRMKNVSNHTVDCGKVPSGGLDAAYIYDVRDESKKVVPKRTGPDVPLFRNFDVWPCAIKPGETATAAGEGAINRFYDMRRPGTYKIRVSRSPSDSGKHKHLEVSSNELTITVVP